MMQYGEENEPMYWHASIDIFLDPLCTVAVLVAMPWARWPVTLVHDRGHHRLVIDPAADKCAGHPLLLNGGLPAGRCDARYERNVDGTGWPDGLLTDLLAEELDQPR